MESSSGKEGSFSPDLAMVLGTLPFESQILTCLSFTSFQFHHPSVSLKVFLFFIFALTNLLVFTYIK